MSNIIWDFDGTIADSMPVVMELFYAQTGLKPFSKEKVEALRNMTLKQVLREVGIPLWQVPRILVKERAAFGRRLSEVPVFDGVEPALKQLHEAGHKMVVMSSNSPENIRRFLHQHDISKYFLEIHGNTGLFGKTSAIKLILRKYKWHAEDCYMIGDETRDVDAGKKAGLFTIAVNWGYNGEEILKQHNPDEFISNVHQLTKLIQ